MLQRVLAALFLLAVVFFGTPCVEAGITVRINIGNDLDNEVDFTTEPANPGPPDINSLFFDDITEDDFVDGLKLDLRVETAETADGSQITEIHIEAGGVVPSVHTTLKVTIIWTGVDLPAGDTLDLLSSLATSFGLDPTTPSTHRAFLNGLPAGGLLASVTGPSDNEMKTARIGPPVGHPMTISSETILFFPDTNGPGSPHSVNFLADAATTVSPIPEAGSLITWGLAAALVGVVGFFRKRRAA